jgi:hypothetical protein
MTIDNRQHFYFGTGRQYVERLAQRVLDEYMLFSSSNAVYLYDETAKIQLTPVSVNRLRELIDQKLCAVRLALRDGRYETERYQLDLNRQALTDVLEYLLRNTPAAPMYVKTLSSMEHDHALQRLRQGEPPMSIAKAYGVSESVILELRRAA